MSRGITDFVEEDHKENKEAYVAMGEVDLDSLQLKIMNLDYTEEHGRPIMHVLGRDSSGSFHHIEVEGHRPSFYIHEDEYDSSVDNHYAVVDTEHGYESLHGEPLVRVYTALPNQVSEMRDLFSETWEADVWYTQVWMLDLGERDGWDRPVTGVEIDLTNAREAYTGDKRVSYDDVSPCDPPDVDPRTIIVDIEVASEDGVPETGRAEWPISTIVAYDSYDEEYVGWCLRHEDHEKHPAWGLDFEVRLFNDESSMLADFNAWVSDKQPDILTGWFSNDFDYPYLINRCRNLNTWSYREWSPLGEVYVSKKWGDPEAKGVSMIDMLEAYQKTRIHKLPNKSLDYVAGEEVGAEKIELELSHTGMWIYEPETFLEYNKRDVELVDQIEGQRGIIDLLGHMRDLTGCEFTDFEFNIVMIGMLTLHKAHQRDVRLPTATKPDVDWFHGAVVLDSVPGLHEHVVYLDFSSLYPSMMLLCNMSPETIVGDDGELAESEYDEDDVYRSFHDPRPENVKEDDDPQFEPVYFVKEDVHEGLMASMVDEMIELKDTYKGKGRKFYTAVKKVTNCFSPDTDVMTPDGIRNIQELEVGDEVISLNPETFEVEVKEVTRTFEYPDYDGDLLHIKTNNIDLKVTENHRLYAYQGKNKDEWGWIEAGDMENGVTYYIPKLRNMCPITTNDVEVESATDGVYCVEVEDNHTILAGRNGTFQFVGQSIWGVAGDKDSFGRGWRLFNVRMAEAITLGGRKCLMFASEVATEALHDMGYEDAEVVIGDTDGFGITIPSAETQEEAVEAALIAADEVNERMPEFEQETFHSDRGVHEIEVDSYATRLFVQAEKGGGGTKKKYAEMVTWEDGEELDEADLVIKGFSYVRSDRSAITKQAQKFAFECLMESDQETAKRTIFSWLEETIEWIVNGELDDDIGIPFGIGQSLDKYGSSEKRPQAQYRGAKYANQFIYGGEAISSGDKPMYYYIREGQVGDNRKTYKAQTAEDGDYVDCISVFEADDLPDGIAIDYEKMIDKVLKKPLERIFRTMEWDFPWEKTIEDALPPEHFREEGQSGLSAERFF